MSGLKRHPARLGLTMVVSLWLVANMSTVFAVEIEGIQNAGLDQPRINAILKTTPAGDPMVAVVDYYGFTFETINIQAFYDTGASGILISTDTADAFGLPPATYNGEPVYFFDVGVGDDLAAFNVSQPLYIGLAPFEPYADIDNQYTADSVYNQNFGPIYAQLGPIDGAVTEGLDVFGMPAMTGKVVVMDPRPVNTLLGTMNTFVYDPGTPFNAAAEQTNPGIPDTHLHVELSYASFADYTVTVPEGATPPSMSYNPFIGPNPLLAVDETLPPDDTRGIEVSYNGNSSTGSWLFDTGAAASIISTHEAAKLGVTVVEGLPEGADPQLAGVPLEEQFTLTIGGIGGSKKVAGFFMDSLTVPTREGTLYQNSELDVTYSGAPVLVADITVEDPDTGEMLTLDGVFGMNYLVGTIFLSETGGVVIGDTVTGAYDWLVFDEPNGLLGLQLNDLFTLPVVECIAGDVNCDDIVNLLDLVTLGENYNKSPATRSMGDLDGNNVVDLMDLVIIGETWGHALYDIPEPTSLALMFSAALLLVRRK